MIDFMIIGAQKCGTTTVYEILARHPDIFLPPNKDRKFLVDSAPNYVSEAELPAYYAGHRGEAVVGCSETSLMSCPSGLKRLHRYNPDMRVVAILRNPIDRAYSAYWYWRSKLLEDSNTFEDALAREPEREHGDFYAVNLRYRAQGRYADQLDEVLSLFPTENVYVGLFEDLRADPEGFLWGMMAWLGVDPTKLNPSEMRGHSNSAGLPRWRLLQAAMVRPPRTLRSTYHAVLPARAKAMLWSRVIEPVLALNRAPFRYPPMAAETRAELAAYFAPHNARLEAMLGRSLDAWR